MIGHNESSTSIFVSWGDVPFSEQNGVIMGYTITYRALPGNSLQSKTVITPENHITLTGLNKYTSYSITVSASTSKGRGNESKPILVITDEDSKFEFVIDQLFPAKRVSLQRSIGTFIL